MRYEWDSGEFSSLKWVKLRSTVGYGLTADSFSIELRESSMPVVVINSCLYDGQHHNVSETFSFDEVPSGSWDAFVRAFTENSSTPAEAVQIARNILKLGSL